ncbi:hypothetical protein NLG97_g667 [Lecanicillium saksenae]|uniref:Uncharacterized protein n=1 Tax=Lecanicillium saksenae TaxID=468837 RepID=A0ACC1RA20_9HYPO|nr:hypothetical protein NLG97_g667 [Lecanicillium saksenae]
MVKITLAAVAALVAAASASNCHTGLNYCGYALTNIGAYTEQINEALRAKGWNINGKNQHDTLFSCQGGPNGEISIIDWCKDRCVDGGQGHNDYCSS